MLFTFPLIIVDVTYFEDMPFKSWYSYSSSSDLHVQIATLVCDIQRIG